jgi:uncharacterized protein YoaH (UPF0181 family)
MKKQTAVEWLQEAMSNKLSSQMGPYFLDLFEQAKAMERNQIMIAHYAGESPRIIHNNSIDYYTSTYGS